MKVKDESQRYLLNGHLVQGQMRGVDDVHDGEAIVSGTEGTP